MDDRRVLLLRPNRLGWAEVRTALAHVPHVTIVGEVPCACHAQQFTSTQHPHVILAGSQVQGVGIAPLLGALRELAPATRVGILADDLDLATYGELVSLGVHAYLLLVWAVWLLLQRPCMATNFVMQRSVYAIRYSRRSRTSPRERERLVVNRTQN